MSPLAIGVTGMAVLVLLLGLRVPVAFAMFAVGFAGVALLNGLAAAMSLMASESFTLASSAEFVVVPLFILMGDVASETGMSRRLYDAAYAIVDPIRGGLASATVIGCGGFAALSGSSVASALTMGNPAQHDDRLMLTRAASGGQLCWARTGLARLRPPSFRFRERDGHRFPKGRVRLRTSSA